MSNRFTEKAEKALNGAVRIAESFGHTYIGSEHILLSLAETQDSVAAILLNKHGATAEKIKNISALIAAAILRLNGAQVPAVAK